MKHVDPPAEPEPEKSENEKLQLFGASEFYAGAAEKLGRASRRKADN